MKENLEYTAEDLIAHKLQRSGILIAKPKFDIEGTDLIAFVLFGDGAKLGRIQCKGRTLISNPTNVRIAKNYVYGTFYAFLYFDIGYDSSNLYCFSSSEIKRNWNLSKNGQDYVLAVSHKNISKNGIVPNLKDFLLNQNKIDEMKMTIQRSVSDTEKQLFELLNLTKQKTKIIEEKSALEKIRDEIRYLEDTSKLENENIKLLEKQLFDGLDEWYRKIPEGITLQMKDIYLEQHSLEVLIRLFTDELKSYIEDGLVEDVLKHFTDNYV